MLNDRLHVDGIPENDRIDNQIETTCFINLRFFQVASYLPLISKMEKLPKIMNLLAFNQLQIDFPAKDRVLDVTENKTPVSSNGTESWEVPNKGSDVSELNVRFCPTESAPSIEI